MRQIYCTLLLLLPAVANAASVNWLDPLAYQKPFAAVVAEPVEATVTNKYWVDLSSGSGTACSKTSPCSIGSVVGKPGTTGGPAYIYIRGSGSIGDLSLYGSAGNEVVVRPWDDATQATITGRNNWTTRHQNVIWDGGPNLRIKFLNNSGGQFDPVVYFNAQSGLHANITFYRTQWQVTGQGEWVSQWGVFTNLRFISNEFYATGASDASNQHHLYFSGASNYGGSTGLYVQYNVFRDTPGEAIEFRLFQTFTDTFIEGNVFHNVGKGTCNAGWGCRSAITLASSGGSWSGTLRIANNIIWDTGEGCVRTWDNPTSTQIYNNTCYNWGMGGKPTGAYSSAAFADYAFDSKVPGDFRNNALYAAGNDANGNKKTAFPGNASLGSFNACASGVSCGSSNQTIAAASFSSVDQSTSTFLTPAAGSTLVGKGTSLSVVTIDFDGFTRSTTTPFDIGAVQFGSRPTSPAVTVQ